MSARHDEYKMDWRKAKPGHKAPSQPESWWEAWPWLVSGLIAALVVLFARSQGWLP